MQTLTQLLGLAVPPGKNTVEFKIIFTKEDYERARDVLIEKGYPLWDDLSADTPVADRLEDIYMLMKAHEHTSGAQEHEWKPGFFKQWTSEEIEQELDRLYRCVVYDRADDIDRQDLWKREVGIVLQKLMRDDMRQLDDAKLMLAAIAYQNQGEYQVDNASMVATPREIHFEKNPPGKDGIVIRVKR